MKLGVFTPVFAGLDTAGMLKKVKALNGIEALELGTGGWPGSDHLDLDRLKEPCHLREYRELIADAGLSISALSCHSNPLHPAPAVAHARRRGVPADRVPCGTAGGAGRRDVLGMPWRRRGRGSSQLDHDAVAAGVSRSTGVAVGPEVDSVLDRCRPFCVEPRRQDRTGAASRVSRLQRRNRAAASRGY